MQSEKIPSQKAAPIRAGLIRFFARVEARPLLTPALRDSPDGVFYHPSVPGGQKTWNLPKKKWPSGTGSGIMLRPPEPPFMPAMCLHPTWLAQPPAGHDHWPRLAFMGGPVSVVPRLAPGVAVRRWTCLPLESHCRHPE
jgi:hypothetical protein